MVKVEATSKYKELNLADKVLGFVPVEGYVFEVSEDRLNILKGNNTYKAEFVKVIEEKKAVLREDKKNYAKKRNI